MSPLLVTTLPAWRCDGAVLRLTLAESPATRSLTGGWLAADVLRPVALEFPDDPDAPRVDDAFLLARTSTSSRCSPTPPPRSAAPTTYPRASGAT